MKNKINSYFPATVTISILIMGSLFLFMGACKKFVEAGLPPSQLASEAVFQDVTTANAAMRNVYTQLRDQGVVKGDPSGISMIMGMYADELTNYRTTDPVTSSFYQNNVSPTDDGARQFWNYNYSVIYAINAVLEGVKQSTVLGESDKNQLEGEALFARAYVHFYLLNLYGAIPYITSTDYQTNSRVHRMSIDSVYAAIITDLKNAETLLPEAYSTPDRLRPNRSVASAMLARVYLYTQKWTLSESEADLVINNTALYTWVNDLDQVFLNTSTGTIWQLGPNRAGNNTAEAISFIFTSGPPPNVSLTNDLVNAFEVGDLRKTHWIGSVTNGTNTWYYPYKYKLNNMTPTSQEYSILFRLEEQYLIRAEARARQGNLVGAKDDLNKIRARAGLANTTANTPDDLVIAILKERRVEFFTELGNRFFDLKRTNQADAILSAVKPNWKPTAAVLPLPEEELLKDPNLMPQNPGY